MAFTQPAGYNYGKEISIQASEVSGGSNFTNFPVLISFTDNDLRTTANGGNVENANGYDILFTLGDCSSTLDHQIEQYDPATGEYIAWVRIPSLSPTVNTNLHMYYGNSSVSSDPSTTAVWSSEYAGVWHMNESPAGTSPQLTDYSSNSNHGTANGSMTAGDLTTGQIGGAIDFDGSNDYFDCGRDASLDATGNLTVSAWINAQRSNGHIINMGGGWNDPGYSLFHLGNRIRIELQRTGEKDIVDNTQPAQNEWHYVALTYNSTSGTIRCIIDGVASPTTGTHTGPIGNAVENLCFGRKEQNGYYFDGLIDEGRVVMAERSTDWLLTEYNNQSNPSSFISISAQFSATDLCMILPIELIDFRASWDVQQNGAVLNWSTASEINNDFFSIEASENGADWEVVGYVAGAGNSSQLLNYEWIDENMTAPVVYYRLKQTDFNGDYSYSHIALVENQMTAENIHIYPMPSTGIFNIDGLEGQSLRLFDAAMREIPMDQVMSINGSSGVLDITSYQEGMYFLQVGSTIKQIVKQ